MRTKPIFIFVIALALAATAAAQAQRATSYKNLKYPAINDIKVPEPVRFELPNGMVVYLVEDHELPTISVAARIRAGSLWEPAQKAGLASITGTVMRTGGSLSRNGDQLDEELDRLGASVETGIGQDSGSASVSVLKEDIDKGIDILADILQHPAFPQDKIDLAKIAQRDGIARRNDNPNGIIFREFGKIIYGKDSPFTRQTEYATIDSITRDDLVAFHKRFFQPENIMLGAWGDFKAADMRARLEKAFAGWQRGGQSKPAVPEVDSAARSRTGLYSVNKAEMKQAWVVMGMLGGRLDDPDYYALSVMNEVLGGGFSSRLFSNVRSNEGLAYAVFSSWAAAYDHPGTFMAAGSSKPETTLKIYKSIRSQVEGLAAKGITAEELARAKDSILKGFAFDFDHTGKIVNRLMTYEYFGYPKDFLQQYRAKVDKVSAADVARVASKYLKPDQFAVLFVGSDNYEAPLSSLGQVAAIDIAIPGPKQQETGAATPEAAAKAKALLTASRQATGGAALMAVNDFTAIATVKVETPQGPMEIKTEGTLSRSGKMLQKLQTPMGEMVLGFDGQAGWMQMGGQTRDMPESQMQDLLGSLMRDRISLLQNFDKYTVQALGPVDFDGKKVEAVAVSDPGRKLQTKVLIDPATNLIVGQQYVAAAMGGPPAETEDTYSDFKDFGGIKIPARTVSKAGGKVRLEVTASDVKINPGVPDSAFKKP
jgi:zinc protease